MKKTITKEYYICQECNTPIINHNQSLVIKGNVHVADYQNDEAKLGAGLIGKNYLEDSYVYHKDTEETSFHPLCLIYYLQKTFKLEF